MFRLCRRKSLKPVSTLPPSQSGTTNPMYGVQWSPARFAPPRMAPSDNGYSLRDAMCTLTAWQVGSDAGLHSQSGRMHWMCRAWPSIFDSGSSTYLMSWDPTKTYVTRVSSETIEGARSVRHWSLG